MLSVAEARRQVLDRCQPLPPETTPLTTAALGRPLAEAVVSDIDMPPFDKAMMDGYAVRCADLSPVGATLAVVEEVAAGQTPTREVGPGQATRIMTGAPVPAGADAVVPVEQTRLLGDRVQVDGPAPPPGANVLPRGRELRRGETVLSAGVVLRPQEFGVLATLGRTAVTQPQAPRLAIVATGDELVEPAMKPGPGQIRNSNAAMLLAQAARAGALPRYLGIARDEVESLRALIREGFETSDVLVLTGGVSAGKRDLVPDVLASLGVAAHFHKVRLKPGKPLFFGSLGNRLVFGLPGNPVSSLVCFELFIRPAVRRLAGFADLDLQAARAALVDDFSYPTDRPTYHPAQLELAADGWRVRPVPWFGSADLRAFLSATALLVLPEGDNALKAGQAVDVLRLES